ncbi:flavin monoamine oxidase family protein [Reyranella sp. CPCC 100927]|uniref:flavin monoamine oxidase family protein n=1 Tax=Reyranella sp. CPCC 100927 TaxID=2599616 RepID=UPI0011B4BA47|nr:flavin monoamine oxidase family protein [Reyranella sp. CPCC 100927]TWT14066.1 flavin monoamine oxidase family protein [Reyranella sp. CPCC 100927]
MSDTEQPAVSRRDLLTLIGTMAGSAVMYQAMTSLGFAADSPYSGPIKLEGDPKGASVLILGAGLAGLVAGLELRKAGYKVQILEYADHIGGRCWTLRGGDRYTEMGGFEQHCEFDKGLYFNPGPWRIPYHHHAMLDYCKRFGVALEPFVQVNYNALLHSRRAFGGKPQRLRHVLSDFNGNVAELLGKAVSQNKLDEMVTKEDKEILLAALRRWGALDKNYTYGASDMTSDRRGYERDPGGGLTGAPTVSQPVGLSDLLKSGLWRHLSVGNTYEYHTTLFQPVGGMDMIVKAMARELQGMIQLDAKVTSIKQDAQRVTVTYQNTKPGGAQRTASADWCICTIPLSILSQMEINVGTEMASAISAVPYDASIKVGLQFKRRFWEQDDAIYGGISYTDLPISLIGYPNNGYNDAGKAVLLGTYAFGPYAYEFTSLPPAERVKKAVEWGAQIHPQYNAEFENGISVGWHRVPGVNGCYGMWTEESRKTHYKNLCQIDGRIALAGEHASYLPAWQEGAVLSALDTISRLHQRVVASR